MTLLVLTTRLSCLRVLEVVVVVFLFSKIYVVNVNCVPRLAVTYSHVCVVVLYYLQMLWGARH